MLLDMLRLFLILVAALLMLGAGVCSAVFLPAAITGDGWGMLVQVMDLAGWAIAVAMFFLLRWLLRQRWAPEREASAPEDGKR